jgi:DNA-binding IclR family transcriptional regulator
VQDEQRIRHQARATNGQISYAAPALEKGLDILELLADATDGLSQNQIAARLGRSVGEIFRMLEVLERRAWLYRSPVEGSYRLSMRMFELAHRHPQIRHLVGVALPLMHQLARTTRQSNHLVVHHDRRILVVAQVDSPEAMGSRSASAPTFRSASTGCLHAPTARSSRRRRPPNSSRR